MKPITSKINLQLANIFKKVEQYILTERFYSVTKSCDSN